MKLIKASAGKHLLNGSKCLYEPVQNLTLQNISKTGSTIKMIQETVSFLFGEEKGRANSLITKVVCTNKQILRRKNASLGTGSSGSYLKQCMYQFELKIKPIKLFVVLNM